MHISKEVDTTRIAKDVLIHPGSVVRGEQTSIGPGTVIGEQGPVVIDNCQIGKEVRLKGFLKMLSCWMEFPWKRVHMFERALFLKSRLNRRADRV